VEKFKKARVNGGSEVFILHCQIDFDRFDCVSLDEPFLSSEDMSKKCRRFNHSTVLIDLTSVEMCSNTTFASAASMQTIATAADATELKEEPSKVSTSRYAKKDAKGSMFLGVTSASCSQHSSQCI